MKIFSSNKNKYFALMGLNGTKEIHVILIGNLVKWKQFMI